MIGIIMLNTRFPRILGDIGNPSSFEYGVLYEFIDQATVARIASSQPIGADLENAFVRAAVALEEKSASVIGTSCGFLAPLQDSIQSAVKIPVLASSLMLIPMLRTMFGKYTCIGVLTFDEQNLSPLHFSGHLNNRTFVQGLPKDGELYQCIRDDRTSLDTNRAKEDVISSVSRLLARHSQIDLFLIECTNISPYKKIVKNKFQRPVFDLVDALEWVASSTAHVTASRQR